MINMKLNNLFLAASMPFHQSLYLKLRDKPKR